jgi:hypothetical protein
MTPFGAAQHGQGGAHAHRTHTARHTPHACLVCRDWDPGWIPLPRICAAGPDERPLDLSEPGWNSPSKVSFRTPQ